MSSPISLRARIGASIKDVHHSLTDAAAMRAWLAEYAEVDLPGRYAFWGRYTPAGTVPRQRPLHVDDHTLSFSWALDGEDTTVDITLEEEDAESTLLSLSQSHVPDRRDDLPSLRGALPTFWALAIANLADFLEGRDPTPMCDFTSPELRAEVIIDASPREVFASLIEPEQFRRWFGAEMEVEPYVGGRWAMGGFELADPPAKILELDPDRRMVMDWGAFVSTWELEGADAKTRLTFVHSGFDAERPPYAGWMGWLAGIAGLRRCHELDDVGPILLRFEIPNVPAGCFPAE